jgi:hypothetical protein
LPLIPIHEIKNFGNRLNIRTTSKKITKKAIDKPGNFRKLMLGVRMVHIALPGLKERSFGVDQRNPIYKSR